MTTFFVAIFLIVSIAIVFDISERTDHFMGKYGFVPTTWEIIFDYYLNFIPYFANLFAPLFIFISVIYFTSRMAFRTEIVAILSSGVSYYRFLRPFVVTAVFLAICVFLLLNFILPSANQKRIAFEKKYFRYKTYEARDIHKQIEPGTFIYAEYFSRETFYGQKFSIEKFKDSKLVYKLMANSFRFDTLENKWILQDYVVRTFQDKEETLDFGFTKDTTFFFGPEFLSKEVKDLETMTYFELLDFIEFEKMLGSELLDFYLIEKYQRTANPFSAIILTLIAVPIASRKIRGGIGLHIGIGIGIGFSYLFFIKVSTTYATNGTMNPMLAVWLPNILYALIAAYLIKRAQK